MDEWVRKIAEVLGFNEMDPDLFALGLLINVVIVTITIYIVFAIEYNLPLPKWIKNLKSGRGGGGGGGGWVTHTISSQVRQPSTIFPLSCKTNLYTKSIKMLTTVNIGVPFAITGDWIDNLLCRFRNSGLTIQSLIEY